MTLLNITTIPSFENIGKGACAILAETNNTIITSNNNLFYFVIFALFAGLALQALILFELRRIKNNG